MVTIRERKVLAQGFRLEEEYREVRATMKFSLCKPQSLVPAAKKGVPNAEARPDKAQTLLPRSRGLGIRV